MPESRTESAAHSALLTLHSAFKNGGSAIPANHAPCRNGLMECWINGPEYRRGRCTTIHQSITPYSGSDWWGRRVLPSLPLACQTSALLMSYIPEKWSG